MQLENITPLLLTFNEEPNIARALAPLDWARDIVVVDSGSTDRTLDLLARDGRIRVFHREFDSPGAQWTYGLTETAIRTDWVLHLDADHIVTDALVAELGMLEPQPHVTGYDARFTYCVRGRKLRSSLYPPKTILFRKNCASFIDDGHTHRVRIQGATALLHGRVLHDDRKGISRWLRGQARYSEAEAQKILTLDSRSLSLADRVRKIGFVAPFGVFVYCLVVKRGLLDGRAGWHYAFERMIAEALLSLRLLTSKASAGKNGEEGP